MSETVPHFSTETVGTGHITEITTTSISRGHNGHALPGARRPVTQTSASGQQGADPEPIGEISTALALSEPARLVVGPPAMTGFRLHIAAGPDRRPWLVRKCLAPKRNVGERRSDRLDGSSGLSGGRTPGEQRRRHFGELRFYTQGLLPRDLLQQLVSTTTADALALNFDVWERIYRLTRPSDWVGRHHG